MNEKELVKRKVVEKDAWKDGDDVCGVDVIDRCASARGVQCSVGLYIHLVVLEIEIVAIIMSLMPKLITWYTLTNDAFWIHTFDMSFSAFLIIYLFLP